MFYRALISFGKPSFITPHMHARAGGYVIGAGVHIYIYIYIYIYKYVCGQK